MCLVLLWKSFKYADLVMILGGNHDMLLFKSLVVIFHKKQKCFLTLIEITSIINNWAPIIIDDNWAPKQHINP